jgi:hypothetical protein
MYFYYQQLFTYEKVSEYLLKGLAIDATNGGLILGPSHDEGGIYMLKNVGNGYSLIGEIEGYEYLHNPAAIGYFNESLSRLNDKSEMIGKFEEYCVPSNIRIIDARTEDKSLHNARLLTLDFRIVPMVICNKYSTKRKLSEINEMNSSVYHEYDGEDYFNTTRVNIFSSVTREQIYSIRYATGDDDRSAYLFGSGPDIKE